MSTSDALRSIPSLLLRTGYVDAHATFGALNLRRRDLATQLDRLAPITRSMVELFWLERAIPATTFDSAPLVDAGILRRSGDAISATCIAMPMFGHVVLLPSPSNTGTIPYGMESFALAMRAGPPRHGRCLDLCSGSGIQALRAAASGCSVVAIEIDPAGAEWARRNAVINTLDDRIDVRTGDLWSVAPDEPFDYIVGNPPYGFVPAALGSLPVHAGGPDGLAVMRGVIAQLPARLARDGVAHFVGGCLGTADRPQILDELRALDMRVVVTVTSRHDLSPGGALTTQLVGMFDRSTDPPRTDGAQILKDHLASLGATHFFHYFFVASHGEPALELTRFEGAGHFL